MSDRQIKLLPDLHEIWQETLGWEPNEMQQQQFQKLYEEVLSVNRQLNLTRITEPMDFWEKHLWDSLTGIRYLNEIDREGKKAAIDIGTGAGFPGIPIAIASSNWNVTLLDATKKKVTFLDGLLTGLNLKNVGTLTGRAEEIGRQKLHREAYDIALVRAVGSASACAEYALPLLKTGGLAILYRGHWSEGDSLALQPALSELSSKIESVKQLETPLSKSIRHCIYLRKQSAISDRFPRAVGVPDRQPL